MKIYKLTKPSDPNTVYIGQTKLTLKRRMQFHKSHAKIYPNKPVYQWYDPTCKIELIEDFNAIEKDHIKEMKYVQEYSDLGFLVLNIYKGDSILNPKEHAEQNSKRFYEKNPNYRINENLSKHPDFVKWTNQIANKAKKEGSSSKEYREKYSIEDYTGPKKIS